MRRRSSTPILAAAFICAIPSRVRVPLSGFIALGPTGWRGLDQGKSEETLNKRAPSANTSTTIKVAHVEIRKLNHDTGQSIILWSKITIAHEKIADVKDLIEDSDMIQSEVGQPQRRDSLSPTTWSAA